MADIHHDYMIKCPGLQTRMFDAEQKIFLNTLLTFATSAVHDVKDIRGHDSQSVKDLIELVGQHPNQEMLLTSAEMLVQPDMYDGRLKKTEMDCEVWIEKVEGQRTTVLTRHMMVPQDGDRRLLMETLVKLQWKDNKNPPLEIMEPPANAFCYRLTVRYNDLGVNGTVTGAFYAKAAYDALTCAVRNNAFSTVKKEHIRECGVQYLTLDVARECQEGQVLALHMWETLVDKRSNIRTADDEQRDRSGRTSVVCRIDDTESDLTLCNVLFQFQTTPTWISLK